MADIVKTINQVNAGLGAANLAVGAAATLVTTIISIIAKRRAAGQPIPDEFEKAIEEYEKALSRVEKLNADYWELPKR